MRAVIDSLCYSLECSVYSQRNNASFFIFRVGGEPGVGESATCSAVVPEEVFTVKFLYSQLSLKVFPFFPDFVYLTGKLKRLRAAFLFMFVLLVVTHILFGDVFMFASW